MFDFFRYITFFLIFKMVKKSSAKYYQKTKKKACKSYQNLSEDEKEDKQQYSCKQCWNPPEDEKQTSVDYRKSYYKVWKNVLR